MDKWQVLKSLICVLAISAGQILFKLAALRERESGGDAMSLTRMMFNPYLLGGLALFVAATLYWIWLLRSVPLSAAYPFMGLAFLLVPVLGSLVLQEPLQARVLLGGAIIAVGIYVANT